jgi:hypothetical protein
MAEIDKSFGVHRSDQNLPRREEESTAKNPQTPKQGQPSAKRPTDRPDKRRPKTDGYGS